jgi:FkbM family methyltransferase
MSWRTSKFVLLLRDVGRSLGLNKFLVLILNGRGYEKFYDTALHTQLKHGDCVWDVGANIGYYTSTFAKQVGPNGKVFSFEPSPVNFHKLKESCKLLSNVKLIPFGLGNYNGEMAFYQGDDDLGATSRFHKYENSRSIKVPVHSGAYIIENGIALIPNVVKIDVEGYELEVIKGLEQILIDTRIRCIGLEVHFKILNELGFKDAPIILESTLKNFGFSVSWPDMSHLIAVRK